MTFILSFLLVATLTAALATFATVRRPPAHSEARTTACSAFRSSRDGIPNRLLNLC